VGVESQVVPSEQMTKEAKEAEPDAGEQVEEVCPFCCVLEWQLMCTRWRRREWMFYPPLHKCNTGRLDKR
jgi:hypothetical protein